MSAEDRAEELRRIVADEIEASLQEAAATVAEIMTERQGPNGWTVSEIRTALAAEDASMMQRYRTIGFASAWEDRNE